MIFQIDVLWLWPSGSAHATQPFLTNIPLQDRKFQSAIRWKSWRRLHPIGKLHSFSAFQSKPICSKYIINEATNCPRSGREQAKSGMPSVRHDLNNLCWIGPTKSGVQTWLYLWSKRWCIKRMLLWNPTSARRRGHPRHERTSKLVAYMGLEQLDHSESKWEMCCRYDRLFQWEVEAQNYEPWKQHCCHVCKVQCRSHVKCTGLAHWPDWLTDCLIEWPTDYLTGSPPGWLTD